MLTNRFLKISIVFISMFLASIASADYALEAGTFTIAGGQVNSTNYGLFSSFGQSQPIEVPVGDATSPSFQLFAGFLSAASDDCTLSAEAGDSYEGDEGSAIQFNANATGGTEPYTFEWDFDGDGEYDDGTGQNPTHTWYDDWENPIGLRVTDASGCQATDTAQVTVNNVSPTVTINCPGEAFEEVEASFVWSFTDPGTEDTHTYVLDFGDGSDPASGTAQVNETITNTHTYPESDIYTVTLTVTDDDSGEGDDTCVVIVRNDITLTLEDASGNEFIVCSGENITINVNINTQGKDINGISARLTFDETYLTIQDADADTERIQPFTKGDFLGGGVLSNSTHNDTLDPGDENGIPGFQLNYSEGRTLGSKAGEGIVASFQLAALLPEGVNEATATIIFDTDSTNNRETTGALPGGSFFYPTFTTPAATITIRRVTTSITLSAPNGGEKIKGGSVYDITWSTTGGGIHHIHLKYSTDSGSNYQNIVSSTDNNGTYQWNPVPTINYSTVRVKAIAEDAGNVLLAEDEIDNDFIIDSTAPETTATLSGTPGENGWYTSDDVTVELSATDNLSDVKYTKYKINDGSWETYSSALTISDEGTTTVYYYSEDNAGNTEAQKEKEIKIDKTPPSVTLTSPNGGEQWGVGTQHDITWQAADAISGVASINIDYSTDGGSTWNSIANGEANDGTYTWTIPDDASTTCRVRITAVDNAGNEATDSSDADFAIIPPQITLELYPSSSVVSPGDTIDMEVRINSGSINVNAIAFKLGITQDSGPGCDQVEVVDQYPPAPIKPFKKGDFLPNAMEFANTKTDCSLTYQIAAFGSTDSGEGVVVTFQLIAQDLPDGVSSVVVTLCFDLQDDHTIIGTDTGNVIPTTSCATIQITGIKKIPVKVPLQSWTRDCAVIVFEIAQSGEMVDTIEAVMPYPHDSYELSTNVPLSSGVYDISAKQYHRLRRVVRDVTIESGMAMVEFSQLLAGDANNDNLINFVGDVLPVAAKFGLCHNEACDFVPEPGAPITPWNADFNGSLCVDFVGDVLPLAANFGKEGEDILGGALAAPTIPQTLSKAATFFLVKNPGFPHNVDDEFNCEIRIDATTASGSEDPGNLQPIKAIGICLTFDNTKITPVNDPPFTQGSYPPGATGFTNQLSGNELKFEAAFFGAGGGSRAESNGLMATVRFRQIASGIAPATFCNVGTGTYYTAGDDPAPRAPEIMYTLTTSVNPTGSGSISLNPSGGTYDAGTLVTLTAIPNEGYNFDNWSGNVSGNSNPTTITMDSNKNVTAHFGVVNQILGDVSGDGHVSAYDAALILQQTVGLRQFTPQQEEAANVSGTGGVTAYDAALILQYVVGTINKFPMQ